MGAVLRVSLEHYRLHESIDEVVLGLAPQVAGQADEATDDRQHAEDL